MKIGVHWEGPDGSFWDLRDGSNGVQISQGGLLGLRHAPSEAFTTQSSFVDGQRVTGHRLKPRPLELPLDIQGTSPEEWFVRDRAITRAFRADAPGKLTIVDPLGGTRTITARLDDNDDDGLENDPTAILGTALTIPLIADDPWYYGTELDHRFEYANPSIGFYGRRGYGPPFYLAPATFTGADTLYNPGDAPAWGVLTLPGPCDNFEVRIGDRVIAGFVDGYSLPAGRTLTIDTDPRQSVARLDDGTNITRRLTSTQFAPIPPGANVLVNVVVYGDTEMSLALTPRYLRAW